jgi:hypothetical protein
MRIAMAPEPMGAAAARAAGRGGSAAPGVGGASLNQKAHFLQNEPNVLNLIEILLSVNGE